MVGEGGIEPPTSRTPCERSTGDLLPDVSILTSRLAISKPIDILKTQIFQKGREMQRLEFGREADRLLQSALASGEEIAVVRFGSNLDFIAGELIKVETPTLERFVIEISGCDAYPLDRVPEEFAREAGFINGFFLQFVLRNLGATEVTIIRFRVVKYLEYDH